MLKSKTLESIFGQFGFLGDAYSWVCGARVRCGLYVSTTATQGTETFYTTACAYVLTSWTKDIPFTCCYTLADALAVAP